MKKKALKILAATLAFLLIGLILFVTNSFVGNPISKLLVKNSVQKYITENYSDLDLEINKVSYNFKDGRYFAYAKSKTSIDTHFAIYCNGYGKVLYDNYESNALGKFNTWIRINDEYRNAVDRVIEEEFPFNCDIAFGEINNKDVDIKHIDLEIDANVNINDYAKDKGKLVIYIMSENLTEETMANTLLQIKEIFDRNNVSFYSIDLVLEKLTIEGKPSEESMRVENFLYEDIYKDGLVDRVNENMKETEEYFKDMDEKKNSNE